MPKYDGDGNDIPWAGAEGVLVGLGFFLGAILDAMGLCSVRVYISREQICRENGLSRNKQKQRYCKPAQNKTDGTARSHY